MTQQDRERCRKTLHQCEIFQAVHDRHIDSLANLMKKRKLDHLEVLLRQDDPSDRFFLLHEGDVRRKRVDTDTGKAHEVKFAIKAKSINSMKVLSGDPVYATVKCVSEKCLVYEMMRNDLLQLMQKRPSIATQMAVGLCEELRNGSRKYATPLLQQTQQEVNIPAVSIAAGIESYYRSALNAMLNARLTGVKAELFPNMHIQVPSRISYICGFKGLRAWLDKNVDADQYNNSVDPTAIRLLTTISPGIVMTPVSSLLEASNAGHMNPESMSVRWMRGIVPRAGREIIFGIGLNQMSDYFEERLAPYFNPNQEMLANAAGSLVAGVISGYLSHVPHNMSTLKLLEPERSYGELYKTFVDKSVPPVIDRAVHRTTHNAQFRQIARYTLATLFPRGVMIRTVQIVGSFMILNGTINYLQIREHHKIQRVLTANPV